MSIKKSAYSAEEERANVLTHSLGFALSIPATFIMLGKAAAEPDFQRILGVLLFGTGLMMLYGASTFYHLSQEEGQRNKRRVLDHSAIYVLIAGTYSPITLITLKNEGGMLIFAVVWFIAIAGIVFKLFFAGRFNLLSTFLYLLMGWLIVFKYQAISNLLSDAALWWIVAGGLSYSIGVLFYLLKNLKYSHSIWHVFVLGGSFCHFMAIWKHIL
ncbi:MAG: hemolysin III family protein [Cyclobacteriaceae bacterium]|nr:hemolysin III family protein [Cyclobacteriaceae bacterium]